MTCQHISPEMAIRRAWRGDAEVAILFLLIADIMRPFAAVAQLDRVLGYDPRGRGFESCQPHQHHGKARPLPVWLFFALGAASSVQLLPNSVLVQRLRYRALQVIGRRNRICETPAIQRAEADDP